MLPGHMYSVCTPTPPPYLQPREYYVRIYVLTGDKLKSMDVDSGSDPYLKVSRQAIHIHLSTPPPDGGHQCPR